MKTYKTVRGFVQAIRKLDAAPPPVPIKGHGYEREKITVGTAETLADAIGKPIENCRHICRVFARRSTRARFRRMQFGGDDYFASPELAAMIRNNPDHVRALAIARAGHREWQQMTAE